MITKKDFLDNGFEIGSERRDENGTIAVPEWELPEELVRQWREDFRSQVYREFYEIGGKRYNAGINCYSFSGSNPLAPDADLKPSQVYLKTPTTIIVFKKGCVELVGEWADGDERMQRVHTYGNDWERFATRLNFDQMLREYLGHWKKIRKDYISVYRKELNSIKRNHREEMEESKEMIKKLEGIIGK